MDRIEIRGLRAFGRHGVTEAERREGQTFVVDLVLELDLGPAARSDDLGDTVHYGDLAQRVATAVRETRFDLIEALAGHLSELALDDPRVEAVEVRVGKPQAPIAEDLDHVAVVLRRARGAGG
ncbi:MAG: dihydroneopterin aldolase [Euzebyaceae bacterium]|nr:dihydroneopterin aldolase [Euzebyaceae bacterium]